MPSALLSAVTVDLWDLASPGKPTVSNPKPLCPLHLYLFSYNHTERQHFIHRQCLQHTTVVLTARGMSAALGSLTQETYGLRSSFLIYTYRASPLSSRFGGQAQESEDLILIYKYDTLNLLWEAHPWEGCKIEAEA